MKKAEIIERLNGLEEILGKDADAFAEEYNKKNPADVYKLERRDTYPFRVGWALEEIKYILNN